MAKQERVDVLDDKGNPTGEVITLTGSNLAGHWHAGVHVGLYTPDRRVLLLQRSRSIMLHPGLWDLGVGGAVSAGERVELAAKREVYEETGILVKELQPIGQWKYNHYLPHYGMHAKVFMHAFVAEIDPADLHLQEGEVRDARLVSLSDVYDALFLHKGLPNIHMEPYSASYKQILLAIARRLGVNYEANMGTNAHSNQRSMFANI